MIPDLTRRKLMQAAMIGLLSPPVTPSALALSFGSVTDGNLANKDRQPALIGCALNRAGSYSIVVADSHGLPLHIIPLPERGHGLAVSSNFDKSEAVAFARRPGSYLQPINYQTGEIFPIVKASSNRHFYGHGGYSKDGNLLFATEGDTTTSKGVIGIYDATDHYKKIGEFSGFGIGPHELKVLNDNTLCIAVGGVHTNGRTPLNLDSMEPCLVYLDFDGNLIQQVRLTDPKLSIRHLALVNDNTIACGQQYRGESDNYPSLIALHSFNSTDKSELTPLHAEPEQWARFNGYIASIAALDDYLLATSPRGNCYGIWSLATNRLVELKHLADASGVVVLNNEFKISSGVGKVVTTNPIISTCSQISSHISWDNHWLRIKD